MERPALAAIGAATLVNALGVAVLNVLWLTGRVVPASGPPRFEAALLPAAFAGAFLAFSSRRSRAVVIFLLYVAAGVVAAALPTTKYWANYWESARAVDADRVLRDIADPVVSRWTALAGTFLAIPFALLRRRALADSRALQGAGVYGIGWLCVQLVFAAAWPISVVPAQPAAWFGFVVSFLPAIATGIFLRGKIAAAFGIGVVLAVPWITIAWFQAREFFAEGGSILASYLVLPASLALLVLIAAAARIVPPRGLALTRA